MKSSNSNNRMIDSCDAALHDVSVDPSAQPSAPNQPQLHSLEGFVNPTVSVGLSHLPGLPGLPQPVGWCPVVVSGLTLSWPVYPRRAYQLETVSTRFMPVTTITSRVR